MIRNLLLFLCMFVAASATGQTTYPGGITGCVLRFTFSNPGGSGNLMTDVSGNGNSGVPTALTSTSGWQGYATTAAKFDGSSSYGVIPYAPTLSPTNLTMVALLRFDGFYSGPCQTNMIFSRGNQAVGGVYNMNVTDAVYDNGNCSTYDSTKQMRSDYVGNNSGMTVPQTTPIQLGKWYFFAGTFDGNSYKAYQVVMDSVHALSAMTPLFTINNLNAMGTSTDDLWIGAGVNPSYRYWFNGAMDEIVLFNRALSSTEVYSIYKYMLKAPSLGISQMKQPNSIACVAHNGVLHIKASDGNSLGHIVVSNPAGQVIVNKTVASAEFDADIANYATGILFVTVRRADDLVSMKVLNW